MIVMNEYLNTAAEIQISQHCCAPSDILPTGGRQRKVTAAEVDLPLVHTSCRVKVNFIKVENGAQDHPFILIWTLQ